MAADTALFRAMPMLSAKVPWQPIGEFPTPVDLLRIGRDTWVKRDDLSAARYGGNKVRTLEALFGAALAAGARRIWAVGALGSNHALATALHARAAGLEPGAMLFPQPSSECARENLLALLAETPALRPLWSWASVPFAILGERRRPGSYVMVPGGATPEGALGYVSAALEVAEQVAAKVFPAPRRIVLGVGSTCTAAGLLVGFAVAEELGLLSRAPQIVAVRVTPWPVTAAFRILGLAVRTGERLAALTGNGRLAVSKGELGGRLEVVGSELGRGYGHTTASGVSAMSVFASAGGPPLDTCYSAKAAAALLARARDAALDGPTLFWATKSSRPLRVAPPDAPLPPRWDRWLAREIPEITRR